MKPVKMMTAAMTAALCLTACSQQQDSGLTFEKIKTDKTVTLGDGEERAECVVHIEMDCAQGFDDPLSEKGKTAKALNDAVAKQIFDTNGLTLKQAADSFANAYTKEYLDNMTALYEEDQKEGGGKKPWYEFSYTVTTETKPGCEGVTVYYATVDYYEGGAHGMNLLNIMNFDNKSGQRIALSDVLVPGYEQRLNTMLLDKLMEVTQTKSIEELHEMGFLYEMEMFPADNFELTSDSISFLYNQYEIAPYALGRIELTIPYGELRKKKEQ